MDSQQYYMEQRIIDSFIDGAKPVFEAAVVMAAKYAKGCGRNTVTSTDMEYGMKYSVCNVAGNITESLFPHVYNDDDDDEEEEEEEEDEFTRYEGEDEFLQAMNTAYDNWHKWNPTSPLEKALYDSISKTM